MSDLHSTMVERLTEFSDLAKRIEGHCSLEVDPHVRANARSISNQLTTIAVKMGNNLLMYGEQKVKNASGN